MTSWTQSDSKLPNQHLHYENEILVRGPITELKPGYETSFNLVEHKEARNANPIACALPSLFISRLA